MGALLNIWPLFGLRVHCPRLEMRIPTIEEYAKLALLAGKVGVSDQDEWTFAHPWNNQQSPELEQGMLQHYWRKMSDWNQRGLWCLMLGIFFNGKLIGMQDAWTRTPYSITGTAETGSWIARSFQGQGFGKEARGGVLHLFFDHLDAREMYSGAFVTNKASLAVSRYWGYQSNGVHLQNVDGRSGFKPIRGLRLTRARWNKRRERVIGYSVSGLEPGLPLLKPTPPEQS